MLPDKWIILRFQSANGKRKSVKVFLIVTFINRKATTHCSVSERSLTALCVTLTITLIQVQQQSTDFKMYTVHSQEPVYQLAIIKNNLVMPRKRSPCSLTQVCLQSIARNMDKLWCKDYEKNFGGKGFVLFNLGPFECMDSDMIQGVIDNLMKSQKLRRIHLDLLITSRLKRLHIQLPPSIPISPIIRMVTSRCTQLVELTLSLDGGKSQSSKHIGLLMDLVKGLPNVAYLDVSESSCNDDVLTAIASKCKMLKVLKVKGCPVTDGGMQSLSGARDNESKCILLHTLDVTRTRVTAKGLAVILDKMEHIRCLYHDDTGLPLWHLHGDGGQYFEGLDVSESKIHKLQTLKTHIFGQEFTFNQSLNLFTIFHKYCPFLTTVDLVNVPSNEALKCLSKHPIKDLSLACDYDSTFITFSEGISPLLQQIGQTLEKLSLSDINDIDVGEIGLYCRNMLYLQLQFYDIRIIEMHYTSNEALVRQHCIKPFSKMQSVEIGMLNRSTDQDLSQVLQPLLTSSTSLKSLSLQNIHSFSDDLIQLVLLSNELHDLESLSLMGCDHTSGETIKEFLTMDNQLYKVALHNCKNIYRRHFDDMMKYIKENKFDVKMTWS